MSVPAAEGTNRLSPGDKRVLGKELLGLSNELLRDELSSEAMGQLVPGYSYGADSSFSLPRHFPDGGEAQHGSPMPPGSTQPSLITLPASIPYALPYTSSVS